MPELEFKGETFARDQRPIDWPLAEFFHMAETIDAEREPSKAMSAVVTLLEQCIDAADWPRFTAHLRQVRPGIEELMEAVLTLSEEATDRPTERPTDSTAGPSPIAASSTGASSLRVIHRLEEKGRPDLAQFVLQASEAS